VTKLTNNTEQQEAPSKLTEHKKTEFLAFPLKTIISPFKAFKEIAQNPDFRGIVLIAGLVLLAATGWYYAYSSKVFFLIDDMSTSLLASNVFSGYILTAISNTVFLFFINWIIYAVILLLVMRAFGEKGGSWRPFFVLVGYAFSVTIIQWAVSALLIATLPEIHLQNTSWPLSKQDQDMFTSKLSEVWDPTIAFQAWKSLNFFYVNVIDIWLIILSVIAVRAFSETTWNKAVMISISTFLIRFFLKVYFLGF